MNKKGEKYGLMVLAVVAVVAVIGLVTYFGNSTVTGAAMAYQSVSRQGTVQTAEQVASEYFPNLASSDCALNVYESAKTLKGEKATKYASEQCGECCADASLLGKISTYDIGVCSSACDGYNEDRLFHIMP